jgi:hypothetical protein
MTPREFQWRLEGASKAERRAMKRTAQLACWLLGALGQKLTVGDLMYLPPDERPKFRMHVN